MKKNNKDEHVWKFVQNGGLIQVQLSSVEDVLNIDKLDPKLWTALSCPVSGVEFSEETLNLLDTDKNGRVRVPEILEGLRFIKKYLVKPEIIMSDGENIPLDCISDELFECGHSAKNSAISVLKILGKQNCNEITLSDICLNDKLFSPSVINGDGIMPPDVITEDDVASVVKDIINCTGGCDDISGVKGINRSQFNDFFNGLKSIKEWKDSSSINAPDVFFLKENTDTAFAIYNKLKDKISDYFLRCSLIAYDKNSQSLMQEQNDKIYIDGEGNLASIDKIAQLPLATCLPNKPLALDSSINPAWYDDVLSFIKNVVIPIFGSEVKSITESHWKKINKLFEPYAKWFMSRPENNVSSLSLDRINQILSSQVEAKIDEYLKKEENHPPIALATVELRKILLYRRDFVTLLKNFVSFEDFYDLNKKAIFQCGQLYIDGRSCDLCFRVLDLKKHGQMSPLSQCFLVYCDCVKHNSDQTMQIAALVTEGSQDNLIVGRNGIFFDRDGDDWDATIVKIVANPVSVKQAFWSPYKKLVRMIQEKLAKTASEAENSMFSKMSKVVDDPKNVKTAASSAKKTDVGTIAAISVAFTGIATVLGGVLDAFLGLGYWIPLGILGIILAISLPSMFIAWSKLRQRNIAPILDASGWAINGNVKITPALGQSFTHLASRPASAYLSSKDPFALKKVPLKRIVFVLVILLILILSVYLILKNPDGINGIFMSIKNMINKFNFKKL